MPKSSPTPLQLVPVGQMMALDLPVLQQVVAGSLGQIVPVHLRHLVARVVGFPERLAVVVVGGRGGRGGGTAPPLGAAEPEECEDDADGERGADADAGFGAGGEGGGGGWLGG